MKKGTLLFAGVSVLLAGSIAAADQYSVDANIEGFGGDGGGDGDAATPSLIFSDTFALPAVDSINWVSFDLSHSFLSDVHLVLRAPNGDEYILAQGDGPTGNPFQHPDGLDGTDLGDGGDLLAGTSNYQFVESGGDQFHGNPEATLPSGTYNAFSWAGGSHAAGDWTVEVWDAWDTVDTGALGSVVVDYTQIPAPAALALFGLGLAGTRRRRG